MQGKANGVLNWLKSLSSFVWDLPDRPGTRKAVTRSVTVVHLKLVSSWLVRRARKQRYSCLAWAFGTALARAEGYDTQQQHGDSMIHDSTVNRYGKVQGRRELLTVLYTRRRCQPGTGWQWPHSESPSHLRRHYIGSGWPDKFNLPVKAMPVRLRSMSLASWTFDSALACWALPAWWRASFRVQDSGSPSQAQLPVTSLRAAGPGHWHGPASESLADSESGTAVATITVTASLSCWALWPAVIALWHPESVRLWPAVIALWHPESVRVQWLQVVKVQARTSVRCLALVSRRSQKLAPMHPFIMMMMRVFVPLHWQSLKLENLNGLWGVWVMYLV